MTRLLVIAYLAFLPLHSSTASDDKWSPEEGNSSFEPSDTVLEQWTGLRDRTDKVMKKPDRYIVNKPQTQQGGQDVSETDLFLLGAIEKLAYRMEYLEKRVTRAEGMLYQLVSGSQITDKFDPCPEYFRRLGNSCYHVSSKQLNWKSASSGCRSLNSVLLEFESGDDEKAMLRILQSDPLYQGKDFWTGGLNPGLLWIWSNSAKPVLTNSTSSLENKPIDGSGRCLLLKYQALTKSYIYKGIDCSSRNFYICRYLENSVERKFERLSREFHFGNFTSNFSLQSQENTSAINPS